MCERCRQRSHMLAAKQGKRRISMARASPSICVVGSANIDLTFRTPRLPQRGETLRGHAFHLGYGGKGANQAVMAARLGAHVTFIGRVGCDLFGDDTLRNLAGQGIDTSYITRDENAATGTAAIVVDDAAQNCILVVPGANAGLSPQDVRDSAGAIQAARILLCQLEVPIETVLEAFRIARADGVQIILNPAPAAPLPEELYRLTDICVPNETELEQLTGHAAIRLGDVEAAARGLLRRGPATVLATLGARGVLIVMAQDVQHIPAIPVDAVDSTGAGDAFIGALGVFLAEGHPLAEAVRWASAAAALSVMRLGAQASFPTRTEVEGLFLGER
jgi:ribokinase